MKLGRILVTGGAGFIGASLVKRLVAEGARVTVFDNFSTGSRKAVDGCGATVIEGDVRDPQAVERAVAGHDAVAHLAGHADVAESIKDPMLDFGVNVAGSLNTLMASVKNGVKRFIFASSSAAVGEAPQPVDENSPLKPLSAYGASKMAVEGYLSACHASYGIQTAALRFSNVYGPGSMMKSDVVSVFFRNALEGRPLAIYGDGGQTRDFIYIDDLCRAIILTLENGRHNAGGPNIWGSAYQLGSGTETSINSLGDMVKRVVERHAGITAPIEYLPPRPGEIIRNYADISNFSRVFGFKPETALPEGLERVWEFFRKELGK
ncbi:MAG: SDR family NAD(P)-dependent oxidoreductase [Nitrospinae bacterium]|nr:SDR family NAD(P)-dependent oxidoreductase [Nitrospinota bacterium]